MSICSDVVTHRRQFSAPTKSTTSGPPLSILICLKSNCWYHNGFPLNDPVRAVFVIIAIAIGRAGALLKRFLGRPDLV